ncbi:HAMP domain-containing protein [Mycolicibacterium rhodesiae NBB3]|uniref:HAMP domain-containing protein n=1 Tax=Mycolicibacterium rhodesiae (strain NBB3) TaxID=710685 RepID=G8RTJ1_MYCRN|nr:CHASE3 domain-containing protein [Mycolicibacterium rhodesiae]AEV75365.1 HAMP domain-containing protein [Mycolicibacterium rhodesiae NBB3]
MATISSNANAEQPGPRIPRRRYLGARLTVQGWLTVVLCVMGVIVIGSSVVVAVLLHRTDIATRQLADTISPARSTAFQLQAWMRDQETGVRGYVITGNPRFLEPYYAGRTAEDTAAAALRQRLSGHDDLLADLTAIETAVDQWRTSYAEPVIARVSPGRPYPLSQGEADSGKAQFDQLRSLFDTQNENLNAARTVARTQLQQDQTSLNRVLTGVLVAILATGLALSLLVRNAVARPVAAVAAACRRIATGDFEARIPVDGPSDIRGIAVDADGMRRRIVDELETSQAARAELHDSEELFRKSFNSSVAGKLMVIRANDQWSVERANPSAQDQLPGLHEAITDLGALMGQDAVAELSTAADSLADDGSARLTLQLADGRSLDVSIAVIGDKPEGIQFVLHFRDVTESERLRQLELEEMNRAAEVQRALVPGVLPATPGWGIGTFTSPARQVGGDFYDVRVDQPSIVLSLGDVMGKGMDAGMLAAATRTALRSNDPATTPSDVLNGAAGILDGDLRRISAFVTLSYVLVDMDSGGFRFADAGHGLLFVIRTTSGTVERLSSEDMPVGVGNHWRQLSDRLALGDMILLVSDGVLDLWGGSIEGLEDAIAQCANGNGMSPQGVVDYLCANAGELVDSDDVTAVALSRNG